jgi:hypothetical protein
MPQVSATKGGCPSTRGNLTFNKITVMPEEQDDRQYSKEELDNHANQLNSNNDAYWQSRGASGRPEDDED